MNIIRAGPRAFSAWGFGVLAALLFPGAAPALADTTSPLFPGVTCATVQVAMRDGTLLATNVYRPTKFARYPVIVQRDPYGRAIGGDCFTGLATLALSGKYSLVNLVQNGYVGVSQNARGTYNSEGTFRPNEQEAQDGYDAIEWAAKQPWSNGKVGLNSGSYLGLTQWQPAIHTPPHLLAMAPAITTSDLHDSWMYDNGVYLLWGTQVWISGSFEADQIIRAGQAQGLPQSAINAHVALWQAAYPANILTKWIWQLPLPAFPEFKLYTPFYYTWVDHPNYDAYWASMDTETRYPNVKVPTLNFGDWYDPFQVGTVRNFLGMRSSGGTLAARAGARLVMGAYGHSGDSGTPTFGSDAVDDPTILLRFFDHYLKGANNGFERDPVVRLYILNPPDIGNNGSGFWVHGSSYPLPGTRSAKFYLQSHGKANTASGNGRLTLNPTSGGEDRFVYNPLDPVPTTGGNFLPGVLAAGAKNQASVETRPDVLVYTSEPLESTLAVIGPVSVTFWAKTSACDTDFTAKLVDVHVDNVPINVLDRVVRARFRQSAKLPPQFVKPNVAYQYTLELGNEGMLFKKGHRVRLEISSSNFPRLARNLNGCQANPNAESVPLIARQTIVHDATHASFLELPVAPGVAAP